MTRLRCLLALLGGLTMPTLAYSQDPAASSGTAAQVEEIYVTRAVRESRSVPTAFCGENRIGLGRALFEDYFSFRSIQTRPSDGLMVESDVERIGDMHVCFLATSDSAILNFYAEGSLSHVTFVGKGECLSVKRDFPERGISTMRCFLELTHLPDSYIGGHLTSNTVLSRIAVGEISDPAGYTQPSIVTVRLWKRR